MYWCKHPLYGRFGFGRASRHGLRNEFGAEDSFMAFMLEARAHPPPSTLVRYAPEFAALPFCMPSADAQPRAARSIL